MVNMTMDDYIKVAYNAENKDMVNDQIRKNEDLTYKYRSSSIYGGAEGSQRQEYERQLNSMSEPEYKYLKMTQMRQLFSAYTERNHGNMWVERTDTNPEHVRRVVGPNARQVLNTGIMVLNNDEIDAINYLANMETDRAIHGGMGFTTQSLYDATQQIIALRDIVCPQYDVEYPNNTVGTFARETDAGSLVFESNRNGFDYGYTRESVSQIIKRCKSPIHRTGKKLLEFLNSRPGEKKSPTLGDQTMEFEEQGE